MGIMDGKICLATGATSGIGFPTALEIARMGATMIILGRDRKKCESAVKTIQDATGSTSVGYILADLASLAQVRDAAAEFSSKHDHLDVLINNAGIFSLRRKLSADGFELTLAVNHLAHFLLTNLLLEALRASRSARVINVSSGAHHGIHLDFDNLMLTGLYNPVRAYGQSKLANILFTYELTRRLAGTKITSNALTPGMVATEMWRKVNKWLTPFIDPFIQRRGKTPLEGAQASIYLATSPEVDGVSGKYFYDRREIESSPESHDPDIARKLWEISLKLTGIKQDA